MDSPFPLLSIFALYLWVVLKVLPEFMKNRKAFKLNNVTRVYNLYQVISCIYCVLRAHQFGFSFRYGWTCLDTPKATDEITEPMMGLYRLYWFFIILRTSEFVETIFFVLRKKQNQVSFLHIYHHIAVASLLWVFLKYSAGMMETFIGLFNSCIHIVMYSYYLLSSFDSMKKVTSKVKRLITTIQIIQLIVLLVHCVRAVMPGCGATKLYYLQAANIAFLIFNFVKFYAKSYSKKA